MISLARYNCTVWSGASHNRPPFFAPYPRREKKRKKKIKKRESDRIEHRYEWWPRASIELPGIPIVISSRLFGAYFYRIGQSAPKLDVSPCASKDDAVIDTPFRLRKIFNNRTIWRHMFEPGAIARSKPATDSRTKSVLSRATVNLSAPNMILYR